ncbi:MAG: hypothetical protein ACRYGR_01275 [Janthinobacterium lividum]
MFKLVYIVSMIFNLVVFESYFSCSLLANQKKLVQILEEINDFTVYKQRSIQTASPHEAFELLKQHCQEMALYYKDLEITLRERYTRYIQAKNQFIAKKALLLNIKNNLGFNLPKKDDPKDFLEIQILFYNDHYRIWSEKFLFLLDNERKKQIFGIQMVPKTDEELLEMKCFLKKDLSSAYSKSFKIVKNNPYKYESSKSFKKLIDELWSLRYAYELIAFWARTDEEIKLLNLPHPQMGQNTVEEAIFKISNL